MRALGRGRTAKALGTLTPASYWMWMYSVNDDASVLLLEILGMRSRNGRAKIEKSPFTDILLPLLFGIGALTPVIPKF